MALIERRHRRSNVHSAALFYQLDASRERSHLDAMILVDEDGLCVASSGNPDLCEEFAVHTAMVCDFTPAFEGAVFAEAKQWDVHMQHFQLHGADLFLCAVGGNAQDRTTEIERAMGGVSRILTA